MLGGGKAAKSVDGGGQVEEKAASLACEEAAMGAEERLT